jgi:hypothetical protein
MSVTVTRPGQINLSGDTLALFLKVFSGEVLTSFQIECVTDPLHQIRTIANGKQAQFPVIGTATAAYLTPGNQVPGQSIAQTEKIISIDSLLTASVSLATIDEAMTHFDLRGPYAENLAKALAITHDNNVIRTMLIAARSSASITGMSGGTQITDANAATVAANLEADLFSAAQKLDEKNVPTNDRNVLIKPAQYYLLAQDKYLVDRDYMSTPGQNGEYPMAKVYQVAGIQLVKTNNYPTTNTSSANTGENNTYFGNFTTSVAVVVQKQAVGTVRLLSLAMEHMRRPDYQDDLFVAKFAEGTGVLRPECAVEIITA